MIKKILKTKKFYIFSAILLSLIGLAVYFISGALKTTDNLNYKAYVGHYETDKNPITSFTYEETKKDIELKEFYTGNVNDNSFTPKDPTSVDGFTFNDTKKDNIGISTMAELVAFSYLCNPDKNESYYKNYLTYNYVLTNNINNDSAALYFIPVGTEQNFSFSGTFNGNNYDITGLSFITITDINGDTFETSYPKTKAAINYFAMFSRNSGTIGNFGLINTNISFNYTSTSNKFDKVAMLCGENSGSIEKVYVRDLRSASSNKSGIMAFGGYIISGLVFNNSGTLKNSYVAYNSIVNGAVFDCHDFNEILYTNTGTVENLYVYNQSVRSIEGEAENATVYPVGGEGNPQIGAEKKITYTNGQTKKRKLYATYCYTYQKQSQDEKEVETKYLNYYMNSKDNQTWFTATTDDFNTTDAAYNMSTLMPTPILRGIKYNTNDAADKYFIIESERDYAFMYEMFNSSSYFASSDFTYQIEANINLNELAPIRYTYSGGIGATIRGKIKTGEESYSGVNNEVKTLPTIYCPEFVETYTKVEGFNAFGLFPYVKKGTIKDLNVVAVASQEGTKAKEISLTVDNQNVAAFGVICGYLDSGKIENVNVYEKIELTGEAKAFIGGAVGVLTGQAVATDVTNNGDITVNITAVPVDSDTGVALDPIDYMKGISIGGVVGYIHNSTADIKNSLNTANITVNGITTVDYTVGGILGAGYTNKIENVENTGNITFDNKYNTLYIAGVIGRHLGMQEQSDGLTNYGDITITNNSNDTYVCGVVNATPITDGADNYLLSNNYKHNGEYYYIATMLTNGSNITINNISHTYRENTHFTDVINVVTSECIVKLSAVYNLAYKQNYAGTKSNIDTANNNVQIIDMNTYHTFSPVLNYEYNSNKYDELEISTAYNLRNIKYTMSSEITGNIDLNYTNVINGDNVTLINVRNEGNMTFDITETFTAKLYASGIIKSISANAKADAVVNGGDIKLNHSSMINGDLYIAGICYENHNTTLNTSIDMYNPNKGTFDAKATGAINNAINAGAIEVTNTAYANDITYKTYGEISNNNQFMLGFRLKTVYSGNYIKGNINVSGITNFNYSIITNTFNIGDLFTANVNQTDGYIMNTAGIVDLNIGQYAYILNSANNGEIKSINLWNDSSVKTDLTAAGIVARNDLNSNLETYSLDNQNPNPHSKQVIAFTINYGSIYAYNYKENVEGANTIPSSKASGIVGMGLLNVVNVLNYGNIFGNETISGIFGVVYFERFQTEVNSSSNKVILANTINYGNTFILYKGYNSGERKSESNDDYYFMTYELFKNAIFDAELFTYTGNLYTTYTTTESGTYARLNGHEMENTWTATSVSNKTINRSDYASYEVTREVSNKSIDGSIFSIINFNNSDNAAFVVIRYLINFEENVPLVGFEPATKDTVVVDRSTIYSAYSHIDVRNNGSGQMIRDTYMGYGSTGNYVVYSPLTNEDGKIKTVTSNSTIDVLNPDTDLKVEEIEYSGVFSRNFEFYKAINKSYSLKDINDFPTDAFLSDFFQFVEYSYINDALVEKIGWKEIAYIAAANNFARTTSSVDLLLHAMDTNGESYNDFKTYALNNTGIWTRWSTNKILLDIINNLIDNNDTSELTTMLKYIFSSESTSNVLITTSIRNEIFDFVSESLNEITLKNILNELITYEDGYSKLLADSILDTDSDVYTFMNEYISQCLSLNELKSLLSDYITILGNYTTNYFNYSVNMQRRYDTLTSIFSSITDDGYFYELLCDLLDINSTSDISDKLKMYQGYQTLTNDYKYQLYARIIANNSETNLNTYLSTMEGEIGYYARLIETGYVTSNIQDTYTSIGSGTTNNSSSSVINDRIELWNKIKYTSTFMNYINDKMTEPKYYFLATEHNNTYQSLTAPSPNGSYLGDLSYYYTSSVTPSTYFYGPYKDSNGSLWTIPNKSYEDSYYLDQVWMGTEKWHSVFVSDSLKYVETYNYFDNINNYYICYNNQTSGYENEIGTESIEGVLPATLYFYEYGYTGANNQFVSSSTIRYNPWQQTGKTDFDGMTGATRTDIGGATLKTTDAILHFGNNDIHLSNAFISYHVINRNKFQIIDANGNQYTINGAFTVEDPNVAEGSLDAIKHTSVGDKCTINTANNTLSYTDASYVVWADFIYRYAKPYYFSEVSTKYHSTKRTGLYQRTGDSKDKGVIWFTHKTSKNNPIYTTQYMDYTVDQLLELDGYYTKFADGTTQCDDERNIINSLFNTYLCNDKTTFEKIIRKALMEVLTNDVNSSLLTAKNGSSSYEFTSATTLVNSISIYRVGGISSSNVQINSTNWYMSNDTIIGYITHNGQYYNNGYKNRTYKYEISIFGITFSNNQTLNTGYVIKIRTGNENYINNTSVSYQNGVLTLKFRHRPNNNNDYYYDFTVPINISLRPSSISVSDGFTVDRSGTNDFLIKQNGNLVATVTKNNGTTTCALNETDYVFNEYNLNTSNTEFLTFICTPKNKINYKYINQFANANINSDKLVSSKIPFEYLINTGTQTVKTYLTSLVANQNDYKTMLITNATNSERKYYALIDKLLDLGVLSNADYLNAKNVTVTGANGVTVSNINNAALNITLANDSTSTLYGGVTYSSTNPRGFNATTLTLSGFDVANIGIIAKGSSANATMTITTTHSDGTVENLNSQTKKVVSNTNSSTYTGAVDTTKAYLYVISQNALYDMVPMNKFKFDTEYFTYNSSTNTYTSVGILFDSTKTYYRDNNGTPRNVTLVNATTGEGNYDNNTQLYSSNRLRDQDKVNDTSVVYYERTNNATPSITLTMSNNVVIYGIYQGSNNIISYNYNIDNYLSSVFCGTSNDHITDLCKILTNLLPIHTDDYATSLYQTDLENVLLQYLNDNPVDDYTLINFYKLVACFSNETFSKLIDELYSANLENIKSIYMGILEAMSSKSGGYAYIADFINKYKEFRNDYSDRFITAASIASDYENQYQQSLSSNNKALLANSRMKQLLSFNNNIQYIKTDGSFDNDKFDALIKYIGLGSSNDVYGIYALASSKGIKNGDFIPDNLNLSSMEAYYQADTNYGFILIDAESADWRKNGKKLASAPYNTRYDDAPNNATTYSDSVNYAFLIDMKQLKKSIATTLFELDLDVEVSSQYTSKYTMYSSEDLIEEYKLTDGSTKKAVIYYVPTNFLEQITTPDKTLTVSDIIISTTAKAYEKDTNNEVEKNNTNYNSNDLVKCKTLFALEYYQNSKFNDSYVLQNAIKIVAEETSVFRYYDIVLMPVDFSFSAKYQTITNTTNYVGTPEDTSATVAAINGVVSIKLQSPVYVQTSDTTMQAGSVYYEKVGNDYIEVDKFEDGHTYYSVYTRATSKQFEAGKTYYTFDTETNKYNTANVTVGGNIIGDYYLAGKAFKLPKGYDLSKYISISLPGGNSIKDAFTFNDIQGNYIVKDDGSADITLDISSTLAKGTYDLSIDLFGCVEKLTLIKNANDDTTFSMKYDGINLNFTDNDGIYEATSMILWGTPFRYLDLYDLTYSDSYELAPNAKMEVTIDTDVDDVDNINKSYDNFKYSVCTYNITIKVTAENGTTTKTYKHILKEYDPFTVGEAYATVYKEGVQILNPALNTTSGSATDSNYVAANVTTLTYPRNEGEPDYRIKYDMSKIYYNGSSSALNDNDIHSYNEYKYDTSGYVSVAEANMTALKPVELLYAGMTVQLNEKIDTGSYTFAFVYKTYTLVNAYYESSYEDVDVIEDTFKTDGTYSDSDDGYLYVRSNDEPYTYTKVNGGTYSSTASYCKLVYKVTTDLKPQDGKTYYTKSDDTYSVADTSEIDSFDKMGVARTLEFPKVTVVKNPAVDAVIESTTFINNYEALGSLATLINPQKSIVPSIEAYNRNSGEPLYNNLIAGNGQKMTVDATDRSIKYVSDTGSSTTDYETATDDYYVVGTTSNANLKNYAPSVALRSEYAKFFQYLSPKKVTNYDGIFNGGKDEDDTNQDYVILNDHKDEYIYLYVLFNDDSVFLVKTNLKDMSYSEIYLTDSKTDGLGDKIADIDKDLGLKGRGLYNIEFDYNNVHYKASTLNGDTSTRNNALYMDYTKATKNERFWYVSYVVFSEDFFLNGLGNDVPKVEDIAENNIWSHRAKFYNIAVIDISNNIRFTIEVDAPDEFSQLLQSLYVTLSYNKYVSSVLTDSKQLSLYAEYQDKLYNSENAQSKVSYVSNGTYYYDDLTTESRIPVGWSGARMDTYIPEYALQLMPTAYYKFYINLPSGYEATYTVTKGKENTYKKNPNSDEAGSYLPPSSLVTQDIKITITIKAKDVDEATSTWGINTSDVIVTEITPDSSVNKTE